MGFYGIRWIFFEKRVILNTDRRSPPAGEPRFILNLWLWHIPMTVDRPYYKGGN